MKELSGPPELGKRYLVPAIRYPFCDRTAWWPVMGPRHEDQELLGFPWQHFHMDWRFATRWAVDKVKRRYAAYGFYYGNMTAHYGLPLMTRNEPVPFETTLRPMACKRVTVPDFLRTVKPFDLVTLAFAGKPVHRGPSGLICPHRGAPLHTLTPDADGVVVCPLHGLHICTKTARVLPIPEPMATWAL